MKKKIHEKTKQVLQNLHTQKAIGSLKPQKSIWGFLGVVLLFILPEIVAFLYGSEITQYAKDQLLVSTGSTLERYYYEMLISLFESGGSWLNLFIGFALLIWLFY